MRTFPLHFLLTTLLILSIGTGCSPKDTDQPVTPHEPAPEPKQTVDLMPPAAPRGNPADVMVEINERQLTRGQMEEEVQMRMQSIRQQVPPEHLPRVEAQTRENVMNQFVMRSVLLDEADRLGIGVSEEEERDAFEEIRQHLPPGTDLEEMMEQSPLGADRMREEVLVGVRINKLIEEQRATPAEVREEEIDRFIEENKDALQMPERVHASHILISVERDADEEAKTAARAQADALRTQLLEGAQFAALAAEHSSCPSGQRGGDLGTFGRGQMVKPFEQAAFSQEVGAIGEVVETDFGFHIVQVLEKHEAGLPPREQIADNLRNEKQRESLRTYIDDLREKADVKYRQGP